MSNTTTAQALQVNEAVSNEFSFVLAPADLPLATRVLPAATNSESVNDDEAVSKNLKEKMRQPDMIMTAQQRHERYYKESNRRISRWEDDYDSRRKSGWSDDAEKVFTP